MVWFSAADEPKIGENVLGSNFNSFVSNKTLKPGKPWTSKMFQEWLMCCDQSQQNPSMQESHKSTSQLRLSDLQFSFYATPDWLLLTTQHSINIILPSWCVCFFFLWGGGWMSARKAMWGMVMALQLILFSWSPKQNCQLCWLHKYFWCSWWFEFHSKIMLLFYWNQGT